MADASAVLGAAMVFDNVRALEEGAVFTDPHSPESSATADPIGLEPEDAPYLGLPDLLEAFAEASAAEASAEVEVEVDPSPQTSGAPSPLRRLFLHSAIASQQSPASDNYRPLSPLPLAPSLSAPAVEAEERGEAQPAAANSSALGSIPSLLSGFQSLGCQREVGPMTQESSSPSRYRNGTPACSSTSSLSREDALKAPGDAANNRAADADIGLQFLCPICLEVCEDAVETPCCHNLFCNGCLLSEEHRIERCPICKSQLQAIDVLPNIPVRRVVADLPCACRFDGCSSKLRRRDRARHEAVCEFLPVRCRFSAECGPLLRGDVARHEAEECPRRPVLCPMACGFTVSFNCLEDHLGLDCPRVLCACEYCEAPVCRAQLPEHIRHHCPRAFLVCGLLEEETQARCDCRLERRHLAEHREVCGFRAMICRHHGCNLVTTARLLESHEDTCQFRRLPCPDCGEEVRMGNLQQHLEAECPDHIVSCPFAAHGCTALIPRRSIGEHLQQATSDHLGFVCNSLESRDVELEIMRMEVAHMREDFEQRLQRLEHADSRNSHNSGFGHHGMSQITSLPSSLPAPRISAMPAMGLEGTSLGPLPPPPPPPPPPVLLPRTVPGVHGTASPVPSSVADSNVEEWLSVTHPATWDMNPPPPFRRAGDSGAPLTSLVPRRSFQGGLATPVMPGSHHTNRMGFGVSGGSAGSAGTGYRTRSQSQLSVPPPPVPHHQWQRRTSSYPVPAWRTEPYQPVSRTYHHDVSGTSMATSDGGHGSQPSVERSLVSDSLTSPLPSPRSPSSIPALPPPPQRTLPQRVSSAGPRLAAVVEIPLETEPEIEIVEDPTAVEIDY